MAGSNLPQSYIHLWAGLLIYTGRLFDTQMHRHHAVQMIATLGDSFEITDQRGTRDTDLAIVSANEPHMVKSPTSSVFLVLADPHSPFAKSLMRFQGGVACDFNALAQHDGHAQRKALFEVFGVEGDGGFLDMDPRIEKVLQHIRHSHAKVASLDELAGVACLSPSRFAYLFKKHVGLPVRRYVLWERLMHAVDLYAHGTSLTTAAHEAHFADQAHLARTIKAHFGISVRDLKNSQFVQVCCHKGC